MGVVSCLSSFFERGVAALQGFIAISITYTMYRYIRQEECSTYVPRYCSQPCPRHLAPPSPVQQIGPT